jgi:succinate-semialdehyde dehydrogenase/glutarate-semialdehyde dehydrogenase
MTPILIAGQWVAGESTQTLHDKYDQQPYAEMAVASAAQVDAAIASAQAAVEGSRIPPYRRYEILMEAARLLEARSPALRELMRHEAGFTIADADNEIRRCIQTLQLSAEEAKRLNGELIPMEAAAGMKDRLGFTIRVPRGVVCCITPFNSPLNTVAHKIAPALAGGNAVVLKPANLTPVTAVELCRAILDAGLPPELLQLVNGPGGRVGRQLLDDPRIAYYAFTGSTRVGKEIQQAAGLRGVQLELGSIASTIVCHDADIAMAIPKIINAGFRKAGQVCTSVQRLFVDRRIADDFTTRFVAATRAIRVGDPADPATLIGPMISREAAERAMAWVEEAVAGGAELLAGGRLDGLVMQPTILRNVAESMRVYCQEVFAPVVCLVEYEDLHDAIRRANDSPYGLAAGLFTRDLSTALRTARQMNFGGVHINEASSARVDVMPFGGVKDSGFGREGPAYAIREMTEERLITIAY